MAARRKAPQVSNKVDEPTASAGGEEHGSEPAQPSDAQGYLGVTPWQRLGAEPAGGLHDVGRLFERSAADVFDAPEPTTPDRAVTMAEFALAAALAMMDPSSPGQRALARAIGEQGTHTKAELIESIDALAAVAKDVEQAEVPGTRTPIAETLAALAIALREPDPEVLKELHAPALRALSARKGAWESCRRLIGTDMRRPVDLGEALVRQLTRVMEDARRNPKDVLGHILVGRVLGLLLAYGSVVGLPSRSPLVLRERLFAWYGQRRWAGEPPWATQADPQKLAMNLLEHLGLGGDVAYRVVRGAADARERRRRAAADDE